MNTERKKISSNLRLVANNSHSGLTAVLLILVFGCREPDELPKIEWPLASSPPRYGVVIEGIQSNSGLEQAGLQETVIYEWRRTSGSLEQLPIAQGVIRHTFDWLWVQIEHIPRGGLEFKGYNSDGLVSLEATSELWRIQVRPLLDEPLLSRYRQVALFEISNRSMALKILNNLLREPKIVDRADLYVWFIIRFSSLLVEAGSWPAHDLAKRVESVPLRIQLLLAIASHHETAGRYPAAVDSYKRAIREVRTVTRDSLLESWVLLRLAQALGSTGKRSLAADAAVTSFGIMKKHISNIEALAKNVVEIVEILHASGRLPELFAVSGYILSKNNIASAAKSLYKMALSELAAGNLDNSATLHIASIEAVSKSASKKLEPGLGISANAPVMNSAISSSSSDLSLSRSPQSIAPAQPNSMPTGGCFCSADRLHQRARLARDLSEKIDLLERAVGASEIAASTGAPQSESQYRGLYKDLVAAYVDAGNHDAAFSTLERSRAQNFLRQLRLRDDVEQYVAPERYAPSLIAPALAQQGSEYLEGSRPAKQGIWIDSYISKLPPLAFISVQEAAEELDPGTIVLSFSVGVSRTVVFVLSSGGILDVYSLWVRQEEVKNLVVRFVDDLTGGVIADEEAVSKQAQELFDLLVGPAYRYLVEANRIVVIGDGPLHRLPFGALRVEVGSGGHNMYLTEWKPIHHILSISVYKLVRDAPSSAGSEILIFADPDFDEQLVQVGPEIQHWPPLPGSGHEARLVQSVLRQGYARVFLGREATEENVRKFVRQAKIVHFATHAYWDEEFPDDSGIVLAGPGGHHQLEDGLLQAWEIAACLDLSAELVVLSMCSSAIGPENGGDGLVSLTRAFQFAGARSVIATLWNISDAETPELIQRFYAYLESGLSKDRALRRSQIDLITGPIKSHKGREIDLSHPKYWAGFQLYGNWL